MKNNWLVNNLNYKATGILIFCFLILSAFGNASARDIYQLKIYSIENEQQELRMDKFLKDAYLPAMHRAGIPKVGVFKPVEADDMAGRLIYVLVPFKSVDQFEKLGSVLNNDKKFLKDGGDYINAAHDNAPYQRIQSILIRSMKTMPEFGVPVHSTPAAERIYELRSYQGATEKLY